ncbi:MAG TPA: metal-dependent transcriptional regulator [Thermoplasmatales archaeon]|nr:metal-dependent transcriptional regulator [Thermoplasmatales archaeon]
MKKREEDYLETIYNISKEKGVAKTVEIAKTLGVKPASVTEMLQKLYSKKLVNYSKYGGVTLTARGMEIGRSVKERHDTLMEVLEILQVPHEIAEKDACIMEHNLNPITIAQLKKFVDFIRKCPRGEPEWIKHFKIYSETGEFPDECRV